MSFQKISPPKDLDQSIRHTLQEQVAGQTPSGQVWQKIQDQIKAKNPPSRSWLFRVSMIVQVTLLMCLVFSSHLVWPRQFMSDLKLIQSDQAQSSYSSSEPLFVDIDAPPRSEDPLPSESGLVAPVDKPPHNFSSDANVLITEKPLEHLPPIWEPFDLINLQK